MATAFNMPTMHCYGSGTSSNSGRYSGNVTYSSVSRSGGNLVINDVKLNLTRYSSSYTTNRLAYRASIGSAGNYFKNNVQFNASGSASGSSYALDLGSPSYSTNGTSVYLGVWVASTGWNLQWTNFQGNTPQGNAANLSGPGRYWNDINVYNPAGVQDYDSATFSLYVSESNKTYTGLLNENDDMTHSEGTYFEVWNIAPTKSYYELSSVSGHDSMNGSRYRKVFNGEGEVLSIYMKYKSYYLDVNGLLDGSAVGNTSGYGTFDVYINGSLVSDNVTDFYTAYPYGTTYEIKGISASTGHTYNGVSSGSLSGTITGTTSVQLKFTTNTYTNYCQCWTWGYKNGEGNNGGNTAFHIGDVPWTATYGTSVSWTADKAKAAPNGFSMRNSIGSSSHSSNGAWTGYTLPYAFTQGAKSYYAEYDYDPINYSIAYTMNGGTNNNSNPSSYNVLYGVTFANPTRSGYDFKGWTIGGTTVTGINVGQNASFSSADDLYNKCKNRTTGNKTVVANWLETKPSNVKINAINVTGPFTIDLAWSATGINISNYTVYYRVQGTSTWSSKNCGTSTSTTLDVAEETTYEFFVRATNPGGTGDSSTSTATTPADQAKIRRKADGKWVKGKTYYKKDGQWVKAKKIYIKVDGQWKIGTNYDS